MGKVKSERRCRELGCTTQPHFGVAGTKERLYCVKHKRTDDVNVSSKRWCLESGCGTHPTYGVRGTKLAIYCGRHKHVEHVDVQHGHCQEPACNSRPTFGLRGTNATRCLAHKFDGYISFASRRCKNTGCEKRAKWGVAGSKHREYCIDHKTVEHSDLDRESRRTCKEQTCGTVPTYGKESGAKPEYCLAHKPEDYRDVISKRCASGGCTRQAIWGKYGGRKEFCKLHAPPGYADVVHTRCSHQNCHIIPSMYNTTGRYCAEHAPPDSSRTSGTCSAANCKVRASFHPRFGEIGPAYCKEHAPPDYRSASARCLAEGCETCPSFCETLHGRPVYCSEHKPAGYIPKTTCHFTGCIKTPTMGEGTKRMFCKEHADDVHVTIPYAKRCVFPGCGISASYAENGKGTPQYCGQHKLHNHLIVGRKYCAYVGCMTTPSFVVSDSPAMFCAAHKPDHSFRSNNRSCAHSGCQTLPSFNTPGMPAKFCAKHKEFDHIPVNDPLCHCGKYAWWGHPGRKPSVCAEHRRGGMIKNPRKRCESIDCKEMALYGYRHALHCVSHKISGELNLLYRTCSRCNLPDIVDENGVCSTCDPNVENRVRLAKQKEVKDYFDASGLRYISYDRVIDNGWLGKERPDFLFDAETHFVIVEVDEEQHRNAPCYCVSEQTRMVNISQILNGKDASEKPVVFIRYNPDAYDAGNGRQVNNSRRKEKLKSYVKFYLQNRPSVFCSVVQLFFDGYTEGTDTIFTLIDGRDIIGVVEAVETSHN